MFRPRGSTALTLAGLAAPLLVSIAVAQGQGAATPVTEDWARNNPPGRVEAQSKPTAKDNMQPTVTPQEREAIGLPVPVWSSEGKVQPAVKGELERQERLIQNDPMAEFQSDRPVGMEGTAYVDVYLRHQRRGEFDSAENQAAIQGAQKRLLTSLTSAEFSLFFAFEYTAGVVGYVNEAGLTKLIADPSVVAIGIDDQAQPEEVRSYDEPQRGVRRAPVERIGKVEAEVYQALEKRDDGYVFVIVSLNSNRTLREGLPVDERHALDRAVQDRVLSSLNAEEFKLRGRCYGFNGFTNIAGLRKLDHHSDVHGVGLDSLLKVDEVDSFERKGPR